MIDIKQNIDKINKYITDNNITITKQMLCDIQLKRNINDTSSIIDKEIRKLNLNFIGIKDNQIVEIRYLF